MKVRPGEKVWWTHVIEATWKTKAERTRRTGTIWANGPEGSKPAQTIYVIPDERLPGEAHAIAVGVYSGDVLEFREKDWYTFLATPQGQQAFAQQARRRAEERLRGKVESKG